MLTIHRCAQFDFGGYLAKVKDLLRIEMATPCKEAIMRTTSILDRSDRKTMSVRRNFAANLWIFHSNKNRRILHIEGDLPFMHCVLMEGELDVASYQPRRLGGWKGDAPPSGEGLPWAIAWDHAGTQTWFDYHRSALRHNDAVRVRTKALREAACREGARSEMVIDRQLERSRVLFDNWLLLSRAMTAAGSMARETEAAVLARLLSEGKPFELGYALQVPDCDPAMMLALVARQLQAGTATANLETELLCPGTLIAKGRP